MAETEFKIEKGVPIHGPGPRRRHPELPFANMAVGDSFVVQPEVGRTVRQLQSWVSTTLRDFIRYEKVKPMKIATRRQADGSVRVWRVA